MLNALFEQAHAMDEKALRKDVFEDVYKRQGQQVITTEIGIISSINQHVAT